MLLFIPSRGKRVAALVAYGLTATLLFILTDPQPSVLRIYENPIILEFVAGAVLGYLYVEGRLAGFSASAGLAMLVAGVAGLVLWHVHDSEFVVLWHGVPATCIVCGALMIEAAGRTPDIGILKILGDASYSIYLVNAAFLSAFNIGALRLHLPVGNMLVGTTLTLVGLFAAAAVGYAVYRLVERPATDLCSRLTRRNRGPAVDASRPAAAAA